MKGAATLSAKPRKRSNTRSSPVNEPLAYSSQSPSLEVVSPGSSANGLSDPPVQNISPVVLYDIQRELVNLREQVRHLGRSSDSCMGNFTTSPSQVGLSSSSGPLSSQPIPPSSLSESLSPHNLSASIASPLNIPSTTESISGQPPFSLAFSSSPSTTHNTPTISAPIPTSLPSSSSDADSLSFPLPAEELLAARDSDTDSDAGETTSARASKRLRKRTMSVSGSLGASIFGGMGTLPAFAAPSATIIDPRLKLRILKNLFVPFEVLVAGDQGKSIHHYLKNPFLTPFNDPKLKVFYPHLNFETWAEGLNIYMLVWTEAHPEDARPLMQYMQMIRHMSKVFPPAVWLGYDREFRILRQQHPLLPWNVPIPQIYFQQLMRVSPYGSRGYESFSRNKDRYWGGRPLGIGVFPQILSARLLQVRDLQRGVILSFLDADTVRILTSTARAGV